MPIGMGKTLGWYRKAHSNERKCNAIKAGGEGGIRTPDTLSGMPVFKTGAINHSATSPDNYSFTIVRQS